MTMKRPANPTNMTYPKSGQVLRWMRLAVDNSGDDDKGYSSCGNGGGVDDGGNRGNRGFHLVGNRRGRGGVVGPRWLVVEGSALRRWPALRSPAPCRLVVTQRSLAICAEVPSGAR